LLLSLVPLSLVLLSLSLSLGQTLSLLGQGRLLQELVRGQGQELGRRDNGCENVDGDRRRANEVGGVVGARTAALGIREGSTNDAQDVGELADDGFVCFVATSLHE
jgi:hypothetical protein